MSTWETPLNDAEQEHMKRYYAAAHAMQTGVAYEIAAEEKVGLKKTGTPKDLRVGVNSTMSDHAALVRLLVEKGLITREEYFKVMADQMESEKLMHQNILKATYGIDVTLI